MNSRSRGSGTESPGVLSRRTFLTSSVLVIGGSSVLADSSTSATFADEESISGGVQIDGNPTLDYQISDLSTSWRAEYAVAYEIEWVENPSIDITIENISSGGASTYTRNGAEGSVSHDGGWGSDGETFRFTFTVYEDGTEVLQNVVEDTSDGSGTGDGDLGGPNSPQFLNIDVVDDSGGWARYIVSYEVSNEEDVSEVRASFQNQDSTNPWASGTRTSSSTPTGSVTFQGLGGGGDEYVISVDLLDTNGVPVDSYEVTDPAADGTDP